jgi:hypothetical protein
LQGILVPNTSWETYASSARTACPPLRTYESVMKYRNRCKKQIARAQDYSWTVNGSDAHALGDHHIVSYDMNVGNYMRNINHATGVCVFYIYSLCVIVLNLQTRLATIVLHFNISAKFTIVP